MNNRLLICVFPEYAKQAYGRRFNQPMHRVGYRTVWGTPERTANFHKRMPFKVKMFHRIHTMVDHKAIGGEANSWQTAWRRLQTHMAMWPDIQKENY